MHFSIYFIKWRIFEYPNNAADTRVLGSSYCNIADFRFLFLLFFEPRSNYCSDNNDEPNKQNPILANRIYDACCNFCCTHSLTSSASSPFSDTKANIFISFSKTAISSYCSFDLISSSILSVGRFTSLNSPNAFPFSSNFS